jgi:type VI protein secretion system component VasK
VTRWDVGAAIALVAVGVLAVVLLWHRMVGDRPGSLAAAGAIVAAVAAAIWSYVMGQRRRVDEAEAKAEEAAERARVETVRADVAAIESAETRDLTAIQVDTVRDVTRIEIEGEHAKATGPAAGELEAILAAYRKDHPDG